MDLIEELGLAKRAAVRAGEILAELARKERQILSSIGRDIKLQADRDAEGAIIALLQAESPHPLLAEESGEHGAPAGGVFWVIDPLDGTMNYARDTPLCCVSIALFEGERPVLGVVYDFVHDELFSGGRGLGAWLGETPMRVSDVTNPAQGVLGTGFPLNRSLEAESVRAFIAGAQRFKKVRMLGTAALMLAWVACGRFDAYSEDDVMLWDIAAGVALVEGAGGGASNCCRRID